MAAPLVQFKKGPSRRPVQSRKRSASPTADSDIASSSTSVIRPEKKNIANPLVQGTKRRRDLNGDEEANTDGGLDDLEYRADEGLTRRGDELATRSNDWDLEVGEDVLKEKKLKLNEDGELDVDDGLYRGNSNYLPTINKTREQLNAKMKTGPIKATSHVRTITVMDYQPDVCKDYKETGFCGYGDSCKFLHDRGDYLAGWQMDNLDATQQAIVEEEDEEEEVPFACLICRQPFTNPVVTKCGHYFCMNCATKRFIKSPKCYACGAPTSGIFNTADKILAKMEARNKAKREAKGIVDEEDGDGIEIGGGSGSDSENDQDEEED
ncbi:pre-mRNA-splicing factor CWC24 [Kwoniella dejecticola CBS 10117]|uniref:Pre-mRNA-splicing factor CWC24 n=1 Tax=Kwoniella dejecticola CBS 10117 TaxID=1296121 RepID=A0A1A5ZYI8_9TREE|nr:pre-mRNA-splicing factor CWC24 [Kwoniella dejecticola CBS 10117]OBR82869.1 pre-mRNA-splicing factor CWC24 [Kwoniella dejecticola CBS 10117]